MNKIKVGIEIIRKIKEFEMVECDEVTMILTPS
jgi:hypothetical protein